MRLALIILLSTISSVLFGQKQLTGVVKDKSNGEGLIGTNVYLLNNWRVGTSTGLNGEFTLEIPKESLKDSLVISFIGFSEKVVPVSQFFRDIFLDPINNKLQEVVVNASPLIAEEFKYQKINKIEIYTNPAAKADPILAVNSMPSSTTADESANISLRGASPIETGIFFNDVPIYDAVRFSQLNGIGTFSIFNTSIVKNLSVFAGNPPLEYGNVTSGLISLNTDDRILEKNQNTLNVSLANFGYSRSQRISDNTSLMFFANYQPSELIKGFNQESLEAIKDFNLGDLGVYLYTKQDRLSWKFFNYSIVESYDYKFRSPSYSGLFSQSKKRNFSVSKLEYQLKQGTISLNNGLSFSKMNFNYSASDNELHKSDWFTGVNYQLMKEKFHLKTGFSFDNRSQRIEGSYPEFGYALDVNHPFVDYSVDEDINVNEVFIYGKYFFSEKIVMGAGLRKNLRFNKDSYWSGQGNLQYKLTDKLKWIIGVGKYNKDALSENSIGQISISSEQLSSDLIFQAPKSNVSASIFHKSNEYGDESINFWGAEFYALRRFTDKIQFDISYTYLNQPNNSISGIPNIGYFVRANGSWKLKNSWTIKSSVLYREGSVNSVVQNSFFNQDLDVFQPLYAEESERLPDYFSLGLAVSRIFFVSEDFNIIAFASANNLTDHDNIRTHIYNQDYSSREEEYFSRRTVYFGAVINF